MCDQWHRTGQLQSPPPAHLGAAHEYSTAMGVNFRGGTKNETHRLVYDSSLSRKSLQTLPLPGTALPFRA